MGLPFILESALERRVCADREFLAGIWWGAPRPGHPEGAVAHHVAHVLANIDAQGSRGERRARLRLAALTHDTFKFKVDVTRPRTGANHHGALARAFTARYCADRRLLELLELHDEAYGAWSLGARRGDWAKARWRAQRLLERLGDPDAVSEYLEFFAADNHTGDKSSEPLEWFRRLAAELQA